jgi:hypothetical protein
MATSNPAYLELVDFLAAGVTPASLISFRPSEVAQARIADLIAREHQGTLPADEVQELDDFLRLEHLMIMAKARARQNLDLG